MGDQSFKSFGRSVKVRKVVRANGRTVAQSMVVQLFNHVQSMVVKLFNGRELIRERS